MSGDDALGRPHRVSLAERIGLRPGKEIRAGAPCCVRNVVARLITLEQREVDEAVESLQEAFAGAPPLYKLGFAARVHRKLVHRYEHRRAPRQTAALFYAPALGTVVPAPRAAVVATYSSQPERGAEVHNRVEPIGEILTGVDEVITAVELRQAITSTVRVAGVVGHQVQAARLAEHDLAHVRPPARLVRPAGLGGISVQLLQGDEPIAR